MGGISGTRTSSSCNALKNRFPLFAFTALTWQNQNCWRLLTLGDKNL